MDRRLVLVIRAYYEAVKEMHQAREEDPNSLRFHVAWDNVDSRFKDIAKIALQVYEEEQNNDQAASASRSKRSES